MIGLVAACSSETEPPVAPPPTAPPPAPIEVTPPAPLEAAAPPIAPRTAPCPEGWRETIDDSARAGEAPLISCEPWPDSGRQACSRGFAHFPGEPGCVAVGAPCPTGSFADDLPPTGVIYVIAGAAPGGDGSRARPFATINDAIAAASSGETIAIGKGRYDEALMITTPSLSFSGACVAETELTQSRYVYGLIAFDVNASGVSLRNVRFSGERTAIRAGPGGTLELEDVAIEDIGHLGLAAEGEGARLSGRNLIIRDVRETAERPDGFGVLCRSGARCELDRLLIERTGLFPFAVQSATVTLSRAAVRSGIAQAIGAGSWMRATATVWEDLHGEVFSVGGGSTLVLRDSRIRRTSMHSFTGGMEVDGGVTLLGGSRGFIERTTIEGSHTAGITVFEGSEAHVSDSIVRDILGDTRAGVLGSGIAVLGGARVYVARVAVLRTRSAAIATQDPGTTLDAEDVIIRDIHSSARGDLGAGITVNSGVQANVRRVAIARSRSHGLIVHGAGSLIEAQDLVVTDMRPSPARTFFGDRQDGRFGFAIELADGAEMRLARARLEKNREAAISVLGGVLAATDLEVSDTTSNDFGVFGRGLTAHAGAAVTIERAWFRRNHEAAIFADDASVDAFDLVVEGTLERSCARFECADQPAGVGVASVAGRVGLTRFVVRGNALVGVQIRDGGDMDLFDGEISGNPIGANVQGDFDTARLANRVVFRDNGLAVDGAMIHIPNGLEAQVLEEIPRP